MEIPVDAYLSLAQTSSLELLPGKAQKRQLPHGLLSSALPNPCRQHRANPKQIRISEGGDTISRMTRLGFRFWQEGLRQHLIF
jgi:hypothetical protein